MDTTKFVVCLMVTRNRITQKMPVRLLTPPNTTYAGQIALGAPPLGYSWLLEYVYSDAQATGTAQPKSQQMWASLGKQAGNVLEVSILPNGDSKQQFNIDAVEDFEFGMSKSYNPPLWIKQLEEVVVAVVLQINFMQDQASGILSQINIAPNLILQYLAGEDPQQTGILS